MFIKVMTGVNRFYTMFNTIRNAFYIFSSAYTLYQFLPVAYTLYQSLPASPVPTGPAMKLLAKKTTTLIDDVMQSRTVEKVRITAFLLLLGAVWYATSSKNKEDQNHVYPTNFQLPIHKQESQRFM